MKRIAGKSLVIVLLFVVQLGLPIVRTSLTGGDYSASEKRFLAPMPTLVQEDGSLNRAVKLELEKWLDDHIGLRQSLVSLAGRVKLNLFHQSPSEQVHVGKDGWYYYAMNHNLTIAEGTYPLSQDELDSIVQNHLAIRDLLAERGIEYVIVLGPSKVSIYPEYIRGMDGEVRITPVDTVGDALEAQGLRVVRLKETLLAAKEEERVFFKIDSHWNHRGAYRVYQKLMEDLRAWGLTDAETVEAEFVEGAFQGEFSAMLGAEDMLPAEKTLISVIRDPQAVNLSYDDRCAGFQALVDQEGILYDAAVYENTEVAGPVVLLFGDSMFGGWGLPELMGESFPEYDYVWDYNIRESIIDTVQPDVLIYEMTERYLNEFPEKNDAFLRSPLNDFDARITDAAWRDGRLTVTVTTTSQSTWRRARFVRCCVWLDGVDSGLRAYLPVDQAVEPGEEIELAFEEEIPAGWTTLEVQMLQETVMYFGNRLAVERP